MSRPDSALTFHLIPHVHWDREWYLSRSGFLARLVPMMDGLLEQLEADPSLRFHLDGQMVLVEDYLQVVPDARGTVEALVRRGQLGIGPWYVLADELIPTGVSLRKNLSLGIRLARELGGEVPVLYSPDAFGHPAGLPDLAAEFGIRWAVLWRGLGSVPGAAGDFHRWTGPAGRSVLVHHLPPEGYEFGIDLVTAGDRLPEVWRRLRSRLLDRAAGPEVAVFVGADHHAPAPSLGGLVSRIRALEPEARVRFSGLAEYFQAAERSTEDPAVAARVGAIQGELRWSPGHTWSLQGVASSRARLKRLHATAERRLIAADRIAPAAEQALLAATWRRLLESQFHDTLCGCCADSVAAEQEVRLQGVLDVADEMIRRSAFAAIGHDPDRAREQPDDARPTLLALNPGTRFPGGVVIAETTWFDRDVLVGPPGNREPAEGLGYRAFHLVAPDGAPVPVQVLRVEPGYERVDAPRHYPDLDRVDRVWIAAWLDPIDGAAVARYRVAEGALEPATVENPVTVTGSGLDNGLVTVTATRSGVTILDRASGRRLDGLLTLESEADAGDLYTPAIVAGTTRRAVQLGRRTLATGPLVGAFEVRWTLRPARGGAVHGRTVVSLRAGDPTVRVAIEFDHWAANHRLRVRLPIAARTVSAGAPLGSERRGAGAAARSWPDEAELPTAPATEFVATTTPQCRIELPGHFEYEADGRGDLLVTLVRAVGELSREDLATRRGHAGWVTPTPGAQEPGRHRVDLTIGVAGHQEPSFGRVLPIWIRAAVG